MQLLLVSTSTTHGTGYLDHCMDEMKALIGDRDRLLFVPYALHDRAGYAARVRERFAGEGVAVDSVHDADDPVAAVEGAEAVFVGGGNTFRLLQTIAEAGLIEPLRARCRDGMPYMGTSAGSNLACPTIMTTNDMPICWPASPQALGLIPFQLNPHYIDPDPGSTHMGETRATRIREFHEMNAVPVLGIREGAMVRLDGSRATLRGSRGARLFRRGDEAREIEAGADLGFLLA